MTPLIGFAPDMDPMEPGVLTDCTNVVPYEFGLEGAPTGLVPANVPVLAAPCIGAAVVQKLDVVRRIFAGTTTRIYELNGGVWNDVSRPTFYTGGTDTRWEFCQFGDASLAANAVAKIQRSPGSGAFVDIASAPIAKIIFSVGAFVMALNVNDGVEKVDGWANSASFNELDWTPSVATLANNGRLVSTPGPITAGGRLGEFAIAYKENAIYVGQFVGGAATFDWVEVPSGNAGCVGQNAWCDVGGIHFIVGPDNFWLFDGQRPSFTGEGVVRQWFYDNSDPTLRYKTECVYDAQENRVWIFFHSVGAVVKDTALVYHVLTKRWGKVSKSITTTLNYITQQITIDGLAALASTISGLPPIPFDSQYWISGGKSLSVFDLTNQMQSLSGPTSDSRMTSGDFGDDEQVTYVHRVRLRFNINPSTASVDMFYKMNEGDSLLFSATSVMTNGQFDTRQTGRFHRARFDMSGYYRLTGIKPYYKTTGTR